MVVLIAPNKFQEQTSNIIDNLDFVRVYCGDLLIIAYRSFEEHLAKAKDVMKQLQLVGIKCNIDECKFAVPKVEYLGYIITIEGIKPEPKKI